MVVWNNQMQLKHSLHVNRSIRTDTSPVKHFLHVESLVNIMLHRYGTIPIT